MDDLSEWDEEELRRGRRRDKNGNFNGRDPVVVPMAVHREMTKRALGDAQRIMQENLVAATTMLTELAISPTVDPKDKLAAIKMIMDRVMGKEVQKVEIGVDAPWQKALSGGIVSMETLEASATDGDIDNEDEEEEQEHEVDA